MGQKLRVLFVASEGVPFAKTGGLADIVGTLPQALEELGVEVKVLMPYYGMVKQGKTPTTLIAEDLEVNLGLINHSFNLMAPAAPGSPFYFVERDEFYERSQLYGTPGEIISTTWSASPFSPARSCPFAVPWTLSPT
jgi:starch synthase